MKNKEIVKKYFRKYFKAQYLQETDHEFKSLVRILNKKDKQMTEGESKEKGDIKILITYIKMLQRHNNMELLEVKEIKEKYNL